jgi:hypothetical protein
MAMTNTSMISRLRTTVSVDTAREADNGLIVPCVKEPERATIELRTDEGLLTPCVREPDGLITPCVKEAAGVRIEPAAGDGLIVPCIKEPERIAIDRVADEGLLVPCIKETDGFLTPCITDAGGLSFERATDDGLLVPCVREADVITIAVQGDIFIRSTQTGTNGETLLDYAVSDRPYWDQNSRDSYDPAAEVTVSGRPLYYSSDVFLIA